MVTSSYTTWIKSYNINYSSYDRLDGLSSTINYSSYMAWDTIVVDPKRVTTSLVLCLVGEFTQKNAIYEVATNMWKCIDHAHYAEKSTVEQSLGYNNVSLNGNLYWTAYNIETRQSFIRSFDCSKEIMKPFCILPCKTFYFCPLCPRSFQGRSVFVVKTMRYNKED